MVSTKYIQGHMVEDVGCLSVGVGRGGDIA